MVHVMASQKRELNLEQRVLGFIRQNRLIEGGQKVLVAVSGGPDSVCLLHTLLSLQTEMNISLHIAHLDHQLRGEESSSDARYVAELARKLEIPVTIEKRDVTSYQTEHHLSLEEAAREVRYRFLAQTAQTVGAARVAVGHTLNDQVETILLHIIRGTGTRGLRGLQPCHTMQFGGNHLTVIRPLLEVKREETEEFCSQLQLKPCQDTSNYSLSPLRNRVRRELLPLLRGYNSGVFESLLRIRRIAQDEQAFLEMETNKAWREVVCLEGQAVLLEKEHFKSLAPALQRQILRRAIDQLLGTLKDIEIRHIEEILEALAKPAGKRIILPEGLVFSIEYDRYMLSLNPEGLIPFPELKGEYKITVPGVTRLPGWRIEAAIKDGESFREGSKSLESRSNDSFTACFDKEQVGAKIKVRARHDGDKFQPLGMDQFKKVGEFMLDARIPRLWRGRIPLVCSPQQIIWVAGWSKSASGRCSGPS